VGDSPVSLAAVPESRKTSGEGEKSSTCLRPGKNSYFCADRVLLLEESRLAQRV
jgi:hypothetical protein